VSWDDLLIFTLPGTSFTIPGTRTTVAGTWLGSGVIVLAERFVLHQEIVKRELLHAALGAATFRVRDMHPPIFRKLGLDLEWLRLQGVGVESRGVLSPTTSPLVPSSAASVPDVFVVQKR
jgi:hypothetical protein